MIIKILAPEWQRQRAVLMVFPHKNSDLWLDYGSLERDDTDSHIDKYLPSINFKIKYNDFALDLC